MVRWISPLSNRVPARLKFLNHPPPLKLGISVESTAPETESGEAAYSSQHILEGQKTSHAGKVSLV